jgi:hypothetical protein
MGYDPSAVICVYLQPRAEELRDKFVDFDGKKKLTANLTAEV